MSIVCRKCGGFGFYLQNRGMQVGMFCDNCGSWMKWVGKKDLDLYKRRGYKIFAQNEKVELKQNKVMGVEAVEAMPDPVTFVPVQENFGVNPSDIKVEKKPDNFADIDAEVERRVAERLKVMEKQGKFAKNTSMEKVETENVGFCPVCDGNPLESEGQSRVEVSIFSGVMTIIDPEGLNIYGLYKLKRCPYCGKLF